MKQNNAIFRRGARDMLLNNPEKLLSKEFAKFDIDWSTINAPWIKVDLSGGFFSSVES